MPKTQTKKPKPKSIEPKVEDLKIVTTIERIESLREEMGEIITCFVQAQMINPKVSAKEICEAMIAKIDNDENWRAIAAFTLLKVAGLVR